MPNVLLTQRCVRSCPYCFAKRHMDESTPDEAMSWENLVYLADLFEHAQEKRFSLLGGEPTLHPDFVDIVVYLLERGFDITVFTSGILEQTRLDEAVFTLRDVPPERLSFVCNINDPVQCKSPLAEVESVKRFLRHFGERSVAGFNIFRTDFDLDFLFPWILEFGLRPSLRIGLTHPIVGQKNRSIPLDALRTIIERLFSYRPKFERYGVVPGLDCGFPMCKFTDDELAWLYRNDERRYNFGCGPVLDIGPDMNVWPCFPLSALRKRSVFEFSTLGEMVRYYDTIHEKVRVEAGGIFPECDSCPARARRLCGGGCIAHAVGAFQTEHRVRVAEVYL